ncbi:MAG TPA: MEDS domain-containing protein [Acidimicrobiia bacterium]|nr:MEDS domain-containing protein [Acidimicrobiia bacterium]
MALTIDHRCAAPNHVVQFYSGDEELAAGVIPYLAEAIDAGGVAIVIATESHRRVFAARLPHAGDRLVMLDADEARHMLLIDGRVARHRFDELIGDLVRNAIAGGAVPGGRPVHAYGEIVARMWAEGEVNAALELEELWNELGHELEFSLYCAYPSAMMAGEADLDAVEEVRRHHAAVVGEPVLPAPPAGVPDEAERTFAANGRGPTDARRFVGEVLVGWDHPGLTDDAAVIVTELATNAVLHARTEFTVTICRRPDGAIRVAVRDASLLPPRQRQAAPLDGSGRGLRLVEAMSAAWGAEPLADGKVIWADLKE